MQYKPIRIIITIDFSKQAQLNSLPVPNCHNSTCFLRRPFRHPGYFHPTALYSTSNFVFQSSCSFYTFSVSPSVTYLFLQSCSYEYRRSYWIVRRMLAGLQCDKPVVLEMTTKEILHFDVSVTLHVYVQKMCRDGLVGIETVYRISLCARYYTTIQIVRWAYAN